jgi:hypothetical protein
MTDLGATAPEAIGTVLGMSAQSADVPLVDLLDDEVDLSPGRYVTADRENYPVEYAALRDEVRRIAQELLDLLPVLPAGPGRIESAPIGLGDLVRSGLVDLNSTAPTSCTDHLDTDFLRGFLRSSANTRRSTTSTGTFRLAVRSAQLPQMDIDRQREYGTAFQRLAAFEERLREAVAVGGRVSALAFDGLTNGALLPVAMDAPTRQDEPREGQEK